MSADPMKKRFIWAQLVDQASEIEGLFKPSNSVRLVDALSLDGVMGEGLLDIEVRLSFDRDNRGRPEVRGRCNWQMESDCVRCDQSLMLDLEADFSLIIVEQEETLSKLNQNEDGIVADGKWIHLVDIIEDPILLAIPMAPRHVNCEQDANGHNAGASNMENVNEQPLEGARDSSKDSASREESPEQNRSNSVAPLAEPLETRKPFAHLRAMMDNERASET